MIRLIIALSLLLASCEATYDFQNVNYSYLFNDNSSKVWLIDRVVQDNITISQFNTVDKDVIIFHRNGKYQFCPLKSMGSENMSTGEYDVYSQKLQLLLEVDTLDLTYDLVHLSEDSILMNRVAKEGVTEQKLKLIPLPVL